MIELYVLTAELGGFWYSVRCDGVKIASGRKTSREGVASEFLAVVERRMASSPDFRDLPMEVHGDPLFEAGRVYAVGEVLDVWYAAAGG